MYMYVYTVLLNISLLLKEKLLNIIYSVQKPKTTRVEQNMHFGITAFETFETY